ncbi:MAG: hypothetical protein LUD74_02295 [Tannerellaceae bacterium]|nr:hypothetical protein [Tannerellaceae bacterium]
MTAQEKIVPVQASLLPPWYASEATNRISFNTLVGLSENELAFTFAGLGNVISNDAYGFQFAGLFNAVGNEGKGFLFAGLMNRVGYRYNGFQMAGLLNTTGQIRGFQFAGLLNKANAVNGFQFAGLVNVAKEVKGVQFAGLINIAENSDYPLGLINMIRNGEKSIALTYNETGSIVASFRSGGRVLYGILGAGVNHRDPDHKLVVEAGYGAHINILPQFRINNELKMTSVNTFSKDRVNQYSFAIIPAYKFSSCMELFAGPSINYMETEDTVNTKIFHGHSLWKKYNEKRLQQVYIGYTCGIQYIF